MTSFSDKISNVQSLLKDLCLTSNFLFFWFLHLEVQPTSVSDVCVLCFLTSNFFRPQFSSAFWPSSDSSLFFCMNFFKLLQIVKWCHHCFWQFLAFLMHQSNLYSKFSLFGKWPILKLSHVGPYYARHDDRQLHDLGYPVSEISCNPESTGHLSVEGIVIIN